MEQKQVIIIGASGHGKVVLDTLERMGNYEVLGFVDDRVDKPVLEQPILGKVSERSNILNSHPQPEVFIAIGDNWTRKKIREEIQGSNPLIQWASAIHPASHIGRGVQLGTGIAVFAGAVINSGSDMGDFTIVGSHTCVDHDNVLAPFASLAPGCHLGGNVSLGECTTVGIGGNLKHGIKIGAHTVIGAGSTVLQDFGDHQVAYGTPAKVIRKRTPGESYL